MSLLQLFIQAIKGEPPPPPTTQPGIVGLRDAQLTAAVLSDTPLATVTVTDRRVGAVALSDAPINPG